MPSWSAHSQISKPVSRCSLPIQGLTGLIPFKVKCLNDAGFERAYAMIGTGIAVDVLTDMLSSGDCLLRYTGQELTISVVSIPTIMLWRVRMKTTQKLGIGAFLCLSFCMIIVACIRFSGQRVRGSSIDVWQYFWLEVEACVPVCMISLTAFRSVFASNLSNANAAKAKPLYSSTVQKNRERRQHALELEGLPTRPKSIRVSGM